MAETIKLYKRSNRALQPSQIEALARHLHVDGKTQQTDEALACHDGTRTLAYAQPCTRFAGLLFFSDQSVAWGDATGKVLDAKRAQAWTQDLLAKFDLLPKAEGAALDFHLEAHETEAIVFDGKERRRVKAKTDVLSQLLLDGIPVVGPRAKVRGVFKSAERPVMLHIGLWDSVAVHETRERLREHDVVRSVQERLAQRENCGAKGYDLCDMRLVYMAGEFNGAPDLLAPEYHVEIQLRETHGRARPAAQGPRQVLRLPAWR